jgi:hypothetical protein
VTEDQPAPVRAPASAAALAVRTAEDGPTAAADLVELLAAQAELTAAITARLQVVDDTEHWQTSGSKAQWAWLVRQAKRPSSTGHCLAPMAESTARGLVRLTRGLQKHTVVAEALRDARLSAGHADVVVSALDELASAVIGTSWHDPQWLAAQEHAVVHAATLSDPVLLRRELTARLQALAPLTAARDDESRTARRKASLTPGYDGMWNLTATLDPHSAQLLHAALQAWRRNDHTAGDTRTPSQRDLDALVGIASSWLDAGTTTQRGVTPHVIIQVPEARMAAHDRACDGHERDSTGTDGTDPGGCGNDDHGGPCGDLHELLPDPFSEPLFTRDDRLLTRDEVSDALTRDGPGGLGPPVPPATYPDGTPVAESVLAALLCTGRLTRLVLDADSQPLDVGRTQRLHSWAMWLAAMTRYDWQCAAEGCQAPAGRLELHHALWWRDGGTTRALDAVPLCHGTVSCHTRVHQGRTLRLTDGRFLDRDGLRSPAAQADAA